MRHWIVGGIVSCGSVDEQIRESFRSGHRETTDAKVFFDASRRNELPHCEACTKNAQAKLGQELAIEWRAERIRHIPSLPLLCLAVLCLSGCLTAVKIGQWQRAVYDWGMDPSASKPCQVASAEASAYLANANQRLAGAGKVTDLSSDSRARELVTSAALACGKEDMP